LRVGTRAEIARQQREIGTTSIYVTHDQAEAMTLGHRICIMNAGQVVQTGAPMQVYRNPASAFVARFLGSPPMNLLPATLAAEGIELAGMMVRLPAPPPVHHDRAVTFGIRPEDLFEDAPPSLPRFPVEVRAIEPLGAETILLLTLGAHELVARVGRATAFRIGERREIAFDPAEVHLFDAATGAALARSP
jgi:multiple sugar transport system ATP-binding protein